MQKAIYQSSGKIYDSERAGESFQASGCTDDWMGSKAGILGFTLELRDEGEIGFLLPPTEIIPTGEEIWPAMVYLMQFAVSNELPEMYKQIQKEETFQNKYDKVIKTSILNFAQNKQ
jgi:hypothetical protein